MPYGNHMQGQRSNLKLLRKISMFKKDRSLLNRSKKDFSSEKGEINIEKKGKYNSGYYKTISKNQDEIRTEKKKVKIAFFFSTLIILSITFFIFNQSNQEIVSNQEQVDELNFINKINEYATYIDEGDSWIEKENWHNAIFRYKQAVDLFPKKYEANYRLILAYSYNCAYKNKDCEIGNELNTKFLKLFPNDENLHKLDRIFNP